MKRERMWCYQVVAETWEHVSLGTYRTYGLQVTKDTGAIEGVIHDVSACETIAGDMARLFTEHQLSPVHFRDAVEDMLP